MTTTFDEGGPQNTNTRSTSHWRYFVLYSGLGAAGIAAAWGTVVLFRVLFPTVSVATPIDELSGVPGGGIAVRLLLVWLRKQKHFHLYVVNSPRQACVQVLRLPPGFLDKLGGPQFQFEGFFENPDRRLLRNITWWGFRGVDACILELKHWENDASGARAQREYTVEVPKTLGRNWETFVIDWQTLQQGGSIQLTTNQIISDCPKMHSLGEFL